MAGPVIAVAQLPMQWTVPANLREIEGAMRLAHAEGAAICAFAELAVTGFHRGIVDEGVPAKVDPALAHVSGLCAGLGLAVAIGAPAFDGGRFDSHWLIDAQGAVQARIDKVGLTAAEATFFAPGAGPRPTAMLAGLRCSAVICREIEDRATLPASLGDGRPQLLFWPGLMRPDPAKPPVDPPAHVADAMAMARATGAWIVQANWPDSLNRPEESAGCGGSACVDPEGRLRWRLPMEGLGLGLFALGDDTPRWLPLDAARRTIPDGWTDPLAARWTPTSAPA